MACYPLSSYVHLPTEPIPYESAMPDSRGHYIDGADADDAGHQQHQEQSQNRGCQQNGIGNHPVPIQIVRPQQVLCLISTSKFSTKSGSGRADGRYVAFLGRVWVQTKQELATWYWKKIRPFFKTAHSHLEKFSLENETSPVALSNQMNVFPFNSTLCLKW